MLHKSIRNSRGSTVLVVACLAILIAVVVGLIQLSFTLSNSQTVRNAVDAGALNVATHAIDVKVPPGKFDDCTDSSGKLGLTTINRAVGKAFLINANAKSMTATGQAGSGEASASQAYADLQSETSFLDEKLSDPSVMTSYFSQLAGGEKAGASGSPQGGGRDGGTGGKTPSLETAFVHRGDQSNLYFNQQQLPSGTNVANAKGIFFPGYTNVEADSRQFYLVPFRKDEMPHLIAPEEFGANTANESAVTQKGGTVPNAFHVTGMVDQAGTSMLAAASAVSNPQRQYALAIPHAYVTVHLEKTTVSWIVNGTVVNSTTYEFEPTTDWGVKLRNVGCGLLNGYASLGNEYNNATLYSVITAMPGNHEPVFTAMLQRLREIDSNYSKAELFALLKKQPIRKGVYDYVLYPNYSTPDNTKPTMQVAAFDEVSAEWFKFDAPEGTGQTIATDKGIDEPNKSWEKVIGSWKVQQHQVEVNGNLSWTPGTGYKQNLGTINVSRSAKVTWTGKCPGGKKG